MMLLLWLWQACSPASHSPAQAAMEGAETIRLQLAQDSLEGVGPAAAQTADALQAAAADYPQAADALQAGVQAAQALRTAPDLQHARLHFGALSQALFALAAAEPSLQEGLDVYTCPMTPGFSRWFQEEGEMANPYMGQAMLRCGSPASWDTPAKSGAETASSGGQDVAFWTCPMHPTIRAHQPDACPICGMDLVSVSTASLDSGEVQIDAARRQLLGIRTAPVQQAPLTAVLRAPGVVGIDEGAQSEVTVRVDGYIEALHVPAAGVTVRRGQPLFSLYSPDLLATQQDLLRNGASSSPHAAELAQAARARLRLWGLTPSQIQSIEDGRAPLRAVPILAPASGVVLRQDAIEGGRVSPGQPLVRIADLRTVWVEARIFEADLDTVQPGQPVTVSFPHLPDLTLAGTVQRVYPYLEGAIRAGRLRVALPNPDGVLKPEMYAEVTIQTGGQSPLLLIPREAVIHAGERKVVFVDRGQDRLQPVEVSLGRVGESAVEVRTGLQAGDAVVVSGNFLVAAESRLRAARGFWAPDADAP